jgi:hypothetical protein
VYLYCRILLKKTAYTAIWQWCKGLSTIINLVYNSGNHPVTLALFLRGSWSLQPLRILTRINPPQIPSGMVIYESILLPKYAIQFILMQYKYEWNEHISMFQYIMFQKTFCGASPNHSCPSGPRLQKVAHHWTTQSRQCELNLRSALFQRVS